MTSRARFRKIPRLTIKGVSNGKIISHKVLPGGGDVDVDAATADKTEEVPSSNTERPTVLNESSVDNEGHAYIQDKIPRAVDEWVAVRSRLLQVYFSQKIAHEQKCVNCLNEINQNGYIKCADCGPNVYYCGEECCQRNHSGSFNPFHKPMKWLPHEQKYQELNTGVTLVCSDHRCNTQKTRTGIQVYDKTGRVHLVAIVVCQCEDECVSFLRHGLWPASVKEPRTAFHLDFLKLVEFMILEGKASLLAVCQAIRWANELTEKQTETLYERLRGEPMEQYRHFVFQIRTMNFLSCEMDDGTECLACPKKDGDLFISLDGNVGLVRKRSAGSSSGYGNHESRLFICNDVQVDNSEDVRESVDCSNFQAGTTVRSQSTMSKLDVSGIFGGACRHGIPRSFIDMTGGGESFAYAVSLIDQLIEQEKGKNLNIYVLYDVACKLDSHLKSKGNPNYKDVALAVPVFHAYGHKPSCQVKYSARWSKGFGLTDGETMERLWAYLRRFAFITKEMTAAHRRDLLTDALLHYARKKNREMDFTLAANMEKAYEISKETEAELEIYCDMFSLTASDVTDMLFQEQDSLCASSVKDFQLNEEERYAKLVNSIAETRTTLADCEDKEQKESHTVQVNRLERDMNSAEEQLGIRERWTTSHPEFELHFSRIQIKQKKTLLFKMYDEAKQYEFTQSLKAKYSERSQKIAARVQNQIIRASRNIKKTLKQYNGWGFTGNCGNIPDVLQYADVCKPEGDVFKQLYENEDPSVTHSDIPKKMRRKITEILSRHLRAEEEKVITEREMLSLLDTLGQRHARILGVLENLKDNERATDGVHEALIRQLEEHHIMYFRARRVFSKWISELPDVPDNLFNIDVTDIIENIIDECTPNIISSDQECSDEEDSY